MSNFNWSDLTAEFCNAAAAEAQSFERKEFTQDGEFKCTIKSANDQPAKDGSHRVSLLVVADTGESGWWNLNVGHASESVSRIARQQLARILAGAGLVGARGPEPLIGVKLTLKVTMKEWGDRAFPNFSIRSVEKSTAAAPVIAPKAPAPAPKKEVVLPPGFEPADDDDDDEIPF